MGKKASRAKHPERFYNVVLRVKGSMKNQLMEAASKHNMTLNDYALYCIWEHIRSERGIPPPGQAQFALADPMAEIHAYITGEEILMPCGLRKCDIDLVEFQGMTFCDTCNVRVE